MKIIPLLLSIILILLDVYLLFTLSRSLINGIIISAIGGLGVSLMTYAIQSEGDKR